MRPVARALPRARIKGHLSGEPRWLLPPETDLAVTEPGPLVSDLPVALRKSLNRVSTRLSAAYLVGLLVCW